MPGPEVAVYAEERQQAIAQLVAQRHRLSVAALAQEYDVTTETVRRDLSSLERMGLVRRVHGGAVPADSLPAIETGLVERDAVHPQRKDRIARAALGLLPPAGSTVLIDAGSTTARLVSLLPRDHRLVVLTHAVQVAARLAAMPQVELHLLPGRVRTTTQAAVGPDTVAALATVRADLCFLGANGVSTGHGMSTPDPDEAATKQAMARASRQVVVLTDSSKIGLELPRRFARLDEVDVVVTDDAVDPDDLAALRAGGPDVVVA